MTPPSLRAAEAIRNRMLECGMTTGLTVQGMAAIIDAELGWKPISEAPKDGTELLLYDAKESISVVGRWGKHNHIPLQGWIRQIELYGEEVDGFDATHFCDLPPPPTL